MSDHEGEVPCGAEPRAQGQLDLALVRASGSGSAAAIEALVERLKCVPRMMHAANARAGNLIGPHDLLDAIQDTMLVTWSKLGSFTGTGPLEAWLHRICELEFRNALRKRRRRASQACDEAAEDALEDGRPRDCPRTDRVQSALRLLDGVDAELVRQRVWDELEFDAMARIGCTSVAAIKARYYRAVRRLQHLCTLLERLEKR